MPHIKTSCHFLKVFICITCLCIGYSLRAQRVDIKLSASDIPIFQKKHQEAKLKENKVVQFNGTYYWCDLYEIDSIVDNCRGWATLYKIKTDPLDNFILETPLSINKETPEDTADNYLRNNGYYNYKSIPKGGGGIITANYAIEASKLYSINFDFLYANSTNATRNYLKVFKKSPDNFKLQIDSTSKISLLITTLLSGKANSYNLDSCLIISDKRIDLLHNTIDSIIINNSYIYNLGLDYDTINGPFEIINSTLNSIRLSSVLFKSYVNFDSYFLPGKSRHATIYMCQFRKHCLLKQSVFNNFVTPPFNYYTNSSILCQYSQFDSNFIIFSYNSLRFKENRFNGLFEIYSFGDTLTGFQFHDYFSKFYGPVLIDRRCMNYCSFDNSSFSGLFTTTSNFSYPFSIPSQDLDGTIWTISLALPDSNYINQYDLHQLAKSFFAKKTKLIVNPNEPFNIYNLSLYSFNDIDILFKSRGLTDSEYINLANDVNTQSFWRLKRTWMFTDTVNEDLYRSGSAFIGALQDYISKSPSIDIDLKNNVLDKVHYWKALLEMDNLYAQHHYREWLLNWIPKLTANFGYEGVWVFVFSTIFFVVIISIMFFISGRQKVSNYISVRGEITEDFETQFAYMSDYPIIPKGSLNYFKIGIRQWASCFWLAAFIFVNPKFPIKFFHIRGWLFMWMFICWLIGIMMLLIFFIYIAAKASFIRTILSL